MLKFAAFDVLSAELVPRRDRRVAGGRAAPPFCRTFKTAHRHAFEYEPRPGFLYVRSRAISSRCNDNYDDFPADEIRKAYRTFVGKPVFVNHRNENHRRARGVIIDAALHEDANPDGSPDTWVEVLMEVDARKFPKLCQAILAGEIDRTSMGTDVAFSVCSFCGNQARTPLEYCQHIPRLKGKRIRRRTASGSHEDVLVREICHGLHFFENSLLVEPPADPTAFTFGVDDRGLHATAASNDLPEGMRMRKTIVEQLPDGSFMTMDETGQIAEFASADAVVRALQKRDNAAARQGESTATVIEWVGMPEGFVPPDLKQATLSVAAVEKRTVPALGYGEKLTLNQRPQDAARVDALLPFIQYGPGYNRAATSHLRDYSLFIGRGEDEVAERYLYLAEVAAGIEEWSDDRAAGRPERLPGMEGVLHFLAYGETIAPAEVDTLRDEKCPVCGEADSYDGDRCMVCGFVKPPDEFMDPDLEKAQQTDLRQQHDDSTAGEGDLKCDNCAKTFKSEQSKGGAPAFIPPKGAAVDHTLKGGDTSLPKPRRDEEEEADPQDADDPDTAPKAGDTCPECGQGTLQPTADTSAPEQPADDADEKPAQDGGDDKDGAEDGDDEDGKDGKDKPPWMKGKGKDKGEKRSSLSGVADLPARDDAEQKGHSMRPALAALAEQQKVIDRQNRVIAVMEDGLRHCEAAIGNIAQLAGLTGEPWFKALAASRGTRLALLKQADENNPAQPIPDPPAEAPAATTEEALGDLNEASVEQVGVVPGATDVAPDATTSLDANGTVLDTPLDLNEQDPTKPVAGTEGPRPLSEVKTETEVRSGTPVDTNVSFPLEGDFAQRQRTSASEARTIACIRLARLRMQAGIEPPGDDLTLATALASTDMPDATIQAEIETLSRVVTAARSQQPQRVVSRSLVPTRAAQAQRVVPSMQGVPDPALAGVVAASSGPHPDEFAFEP